MTRDYVSLYLMASQYEYSAANFLSLLLLSMGRLFPIITLSPFFGGKILPRPVKVGFGLALFAVMLPQLLLVTKTPIDFDMRLLMLFFKEIFIGLIIGNDFLMFSCFFIALVTSRSLKDLKRK